MIMLMPGSEEYLKFTWVSLWLPGPSPPLTPTAALQVAPNWYEKGKKCTSGFMAKTGSGFLSPFLQMVAVGKTKQTDPNCQPHWT